MRKKLAVAGLMVVLFLALVTVNCAYADFTNIFMTDSNGSTTPKSTFTLDETPWLYLELPHSGFNVGVSFWTSPSSDPFFVQGLSTGSQYWLSLDSGLDDDNNPISWDSVKQLGLWNINAGYLYPLSDRRNPESGVGTASFNVTAVPEPVASVLFITGGTMLLVRRLRKGKK